MTIADTQGVLAERGTTHGEYSRLAERIQELKQVMRSGLNWEMLPAHMQETLDMYAVKIGRVVEGNYSHHDHWDDIVGYTDLVRNRLPERANVEK